ncbi:MAG: 16S rRNA (uracil(1498)-N(3))-methyltransferase [Deltaproteobacteria bacterium]|nr:16S rRNA (uracil(1498)-N(3))-methyltransferase [Deltaproteobacteria bacterium]
MPQGSLRQGTLALSADESRRARTVLRLEVGDSVELFDGQGFAAPARVAEMTDVVTLDVGPVREAGRAPPLCVAQALAKGDKMELVIQKATELGAAEIVPFASARAVVKLDAAKAHERVARWQKIAQEAARQCGRADTPAVAELSDLRAVLARPGARGLLFEGATDIRLGAFLDSAGDAPVTLLIGPEGGFSADEVEQARRAGAAIVGLGSRILRTETVALAALAIALHRRGELG